MSAYGGIAEWLEADNRLWYEERPRIIVHYYRTKPTEIRAFVNMEYRPNTADIKAGMERALSAGSVVFTQITNCFLQSWSGTTSAWWVAEVIE